MAILRILFRRGSSGRLRLMAVANVVACAFVTVMTLLTTVISYFVIVPTIFKNSEQSVFIHRFAIGYLFVNVCGNFVLCVCVDTSTARPHRRTVRRKNNVPPRVASLKGNPLDKTSSKSCSTDSASKEAHVSNTETAQDDTSSLPDSGISSKSLSGCQKNLNKSTNAMNSQSDIQSHNNKTGQYDVRVNDTVENEHGSTTSDNSTRRNVAGCDTGNCSSNAQISKRVSASQSAYSQNSSGSDAQKSSSAKQLPKTSEPGRSHVCKLCEKRILRRDHHCFFMTVCIGYHNHKHFIFFCLYMMLGALYGVILTVKYLHLLYKVRFWGPQTFLLLLLQVVNNVWVKGMVPTPFFCLLLFQLYVCLLVGLAAAGFLYWHLAITVNGQTTHEASSGDVRYRRRLTHNLRDVFGRFWPLLFLLPLPLPQAGDGRSYTAADTAATNARGKKHGTSTKTENVTTKNGNYGDGATVRGENSGSACTQASIVSSQGELRNVVRDRRRGCARVGKGVGKT